jgi:hypothetical protein
MNPPAKATAVAELTLPSAHIGADPEHVRNTSQHVVQLSMQRFTERNSSLSDILHLF